MNKKKKATTNPTTLRLSPTQKKQVVVGAELLGITEAEYVRLCVDIGNKFMSIIIE